MSRLCSFSSTFLQNETYHSMRCTHRICALYIDILNGIQLEEISKEEFFQKCQTYFTKTSETPLHSAATDNCIRGVKLLLSYGVDVNATDSGGQTPLHRAAFRKHSAVVKILLENNANPNCQTNGYQLTPLFFCKDKESMKFLILYGADTTIKNSLAFTALEILNSDLKPYCLSCVNEVNEMKKIKLNHTASLYDFLFMQPRRKAYFTDNQVIKELFDKQQSFINKFSNYGSMLDAQYEVSRDEKKLLSTAQESFGRLTKCFLPDIYYKELFSYLNVNDLKNLSISVFKECSNKKFKTEKKQEKTNLRRSKRVLIKD